MLLEIFRYFLPGSLLLEFLSNSFIRMFLAAFTSLGVWFLLGPRFIKLLYECKIGQKIRMEECPLLGQLHEKKKETPTMGGALIILSIALSAFFWIDWSYLNSWLLIIGLVGYGLIGAYDDFLKLKWKNPKGLSAKKKLFAQVSIAVFISSLLLSPQLQQLSSLKASSAYTAVDAFLVELMFDPFSLSEVKPPIEPISCSKLHHQIYFPCIKTPLQIPQGVLPNLLIAAFFAFVMTGSSNAVNLTDGLDGLAAGAIIMASSTLVIVSFCSQNFLLASFFGLPLIEGSGEIAIFLMALIGSCLGFLWFNSHPAQLFMGDTGSLGMGGAMALAAILIRQEFFFAIASSLFVIETLSVIIQVWSYRSRGKRLFLCSPLHHHFEYKGWPETKVVFRFWLLSAIFAMLALFTLGW